MGDYTDASGVLHGFVLNRGTFTTIDVPGAFETVASGINAQGDIVHVQNFGRIILDEKGAPSRLLGVSWDVTKEVVASELLRQQTEAAIGQADLVVFLIDARAGVLGAIGMAFADSGEIPHSAA